MPSGPDVPMVDPDAVPVQPPRDKAAEARDIAMVAALQQLQQDQNYVRRHIDVQADLKAKLEVSNTNKNEQILRLIHENRVHTPTHYPSLKHR